MLSQVFVTMNDLGIFSMVFDYLGYLWMFLMIMWKATVAYQLSCEITANSTTMWSSRVGCILDIQHSNIYKTNPTHWWGGCVAYFLRHPSESYGPRGRLTPSYFGKNMKGKPQNPVSLLVQMNKITRQNAPFTSMEVTQKNQHSRLM